MHVLPLQDQPEAAGESGPRRADSSPSKASCSGTERGGERGGEGAIGNEMMDRDTVKG